MEADEALSLTLLTMPDLSASTEYAQLLPVGDTCIQREVPEAAVF